MKYKFILVFFVSLGGFKKVSNLHFRDELVIARLPCTVWPIYFSFLTFCYFSQNMRNSENIGHLALETVT